MGLISFVKEAGAFLFGHSAGESQPASAASQLTVELLQKQAAAVGVTVQNLAIELNDGTATVRALSLVSLNAKNSFSQSAIHQESVRSMISLR